MGGAEQEADIPEAICDGVTDATLAALAGFVFYCDPAQTPPVLAAAMVRAMLVVKSAQGEAQDKYREKAKALFEVIFIRSRKAQAMVTTGAIPAEFLSSVKAHRVASVVLRKLLAR